METPSQKLSAQIIDKLIAGNLLSEAEGKKLVTKLAEGKVRPEDWRLSIEVSEKNETTP